MISDPTDNIDNALDDAKVNALTAKLDMAIIVMGTPMMYYVLPVAELCDIIGHIKPYESWKWQLLFIIDKDGELAYTWVEGG